jgi:hypothetical protein
MQHDRIQSPGKNSVDVKMLFWYHASLLGLLALANIATPVPLNKIQILQRTPENAVVFRLGDISYLANTARPLTTAKLITGHHGPDLGPVDVPITVLNTNSSSLTAATVNQTISSYLASDDVFTADFLANVFITSSVGRLKADLTALKQLQDLGAAQIYATEGVQATSDYGSHATISQAAVNVTLPSGPYLAKIVAGTVSFAPVYRLYEDSYRDFLFGTYDTGDGSGSFTSLDRSLPNFGYPAIPVPSRLYYWNDPRPL